LTYGLFCAIVLPVPDDRDDDFITGDYEGTGDSHCGNLISKLTWVMVLVCAPLFIDAVARMTNPKHEAFYVQGYKWMTKPSGPTSAPVATAPAVEVPSKKQSAFARLE
jgi:hypothetical protein